MIKKIETITPGNLYFAQSEQKYLKIGYSHALSGGSRYYIAKFTEKELDTWKDKMPESSNSNSYQIEDILEHLNYCGYELVVDKPKKEEYSMSAGLFNIDDL